MNLDHKVRFGLLEENFSQNQLEIITVFLIEDDTIIRIMFYKENGFQRCQMEKDHAITDNRPTSEEK